MTDPREAEAAWEEQNIVELSDKWDEPDAIHYEPTGYGIDMQGNRSRITVYRKMTREELAAGARKPKKRVKP